MPAAPASPDRHWLASGGWEGKVPIWDAASAAKVNSWYGPKGGARTCFVAQFVSGKLQEGRHQSVFLRRSTQAISARLPGLLRR